MTMPLRGWLVGAAGIAIIATACTQPGERPPLPKTAPNVILLTVDTLRADHLGSYGYSRKTAPFFDSLAEQGVLFERAYSTSSWTVPAVVSLVTGRSPSVHGIIFGAARDNRIIEQQPIPMTLPTLPEMLHDLGYTTFGLTSNGHLLAPLGFARGFDQYECLGFADAVELEVVFEQWFEKINNSEPYFLWLHFLDPHAPYRVQEPYFTEIWGKKKRHNALLGESAARNYDVLNLDRQSDEVAFIQALYDSEIRRVDEIARTVLSRLTGQRNTLTIFSSDHGEEFLDHGRFGHGRTLYEESVRVPLVVVLPDGRHAGRRIQTPVSLLDVIPSMADVLGVHWGTVVDGQSWMPLLSNGPVATNRDLFLSLSRGRELRAVVSDSWKFVYDLNDPKMNELFELDTDPHELTNRQDDDSTRAKETRSRIVDHIVAASSEHHRGGSIEMSKEHTEQLRALGYLD